MPSTPKPKKYVAVANLSWGPHTFAPGDEVPADSAELAALLRFGDEFVMSPRTALADKTKPELLEHAESKGVEVSPSMTKGEILVAVQTFGSKSAADSTGPTADTPSEED